jgi:hypothetical protein
VAGWAGAAVVVVVEVAGGLDFLRVREVSVAMLEFVPE